MYQTGNVDILTLKQLLGHSSVGTTQIYTHLQEFQVRAAIEQNPLGTVTQKKKSLDTTGVEAGKSSGHNASVLSETNDETEDFTQPMDAFEGAANDGIRVDVSALSESDEPDKTEQ